ncbi:MAG: four helix bundle protein [Armatimonadota bacterium]|jgi:four helix bundle protein
MAFLFQNLRVYQQALAFADGASTLTAGFPRASWYLADQLNRASLSIALNIAESTGRVTNGDRRRFLIIARGSAHECAALLDMCGRKRVLSDVQCAELGEHLVTISKMLSGMIRRYGGSEAVGEAQEEYTP